MRLGVKAFDSSRHPQIRKDLEKLPDRLSEQFEKVIDELVSGSVSTGRKLQLLKKTKSVYSVRLDKKHRFVFIVDEDSIAVPLTVCVSDKVNSYLKRQRLQR